MINFQQFEVLSFDCYGTLIDWESGILTALKAILSQHDISLSDNQILDLYGKIESNLEAGEHLKYRDILRGVVQGLGQELNFQPTESEINSLPESLKNWQPFPDTVAALKALKQRYKLTIISNTDNDLFAETNKHLDINFDWIITAEEVKSYKPSVRNFDFALQKMGINKDKWLHVAQSVYHDIVPAKSLGIATVWVNRRQGKEGSGASIPAIAKPDLEVPDLATLVSMMKLN